MQNQMFGIIQKRGITVMEAVTDCHILLWRERERERERRERERERRERETERERERERERDRKNVMKQTQQNNLLIAPLGSEVFKAAPAFLRSRILSGQRWRRRPLEGYWPCFFLCGRPDGNRRCRGR